MAETEQRALGSIGEPLQILAELIHFKRQWVAARVFGAGVALPLKAGEAHSIWDRIFDYSVG